MDSDLQQGEKLMCHAQSFHLDPTWRHFGGVATTTDVEWMFLVAGLTVTKHRFNLSDESVCACVVLKDWFKSGLVPIEQVL